MDQRRQRRVESDYLWLPVRPGAETRCVSVFCGTEKVLELEIPCFLPSEGAEEGTGWYYACLPAAEYRGRVLTFEGAPAAWVDSLRCEPAPPPPPAGPRPLLHFTPPAGWVNDPNGLVYSGGSYHLYYQFNPCDTVWGNMSWGHAVSADLFHWRREDPVLLPDATGTMFSGCAVRDDAGAAGDGAGRLLYYYTAAGGTNRWSQGKPYLQCLAVGNGDGSRLEKTGRVMVPALAEGTRDPKVLYHAPTGAYVMVLYLSGNEFAIFRSEDLVNWKESQRLTLEGAWECPDLFALPVDGGGKQWVFWSADGYYFPGEFDGCRFTPTHPRRCAYAGGEPRPVDRPFRPGVTLLPYAAQTVYGTEGGRVIGIAWLRMPNPPGEGENRLPYTGMMSLPVELSLTADRRLRMRPVRELDALRGPRMPLDDRGLEMGTAFAVELTLSGGRAEVFLPGGRLEADGDAGVCRFVSALSERAFSWERARGLSLLLVADTGIVEIFAQDGTAVLACETAPVLAGRVRCRMRGQGEAFAARLSLRAGGDRFDG